MFKQNSLKIVFIAKSARRGLSVNDFENKLNYCKSREENEEAELKK
jgi:hypothetical protein